MQISEFHKYKHILFEHKFEIVMCTQQQFGSPLAEY